MVQLNIPDQFLDPTLDPKVDTFTESICTKITQDLLLKPDHVALASEPDNIPTRLLCAAVWFKLNCMFFSQGTQKEASTKFTVREKQLSRLLTGHKYFSRSDKKRQQEEANGDKRKKLHRKKSQPTKTAIKSPKEEE